MADINKDEEITIESEGVTTKPFLCGRLPIWTGIERFNPEDEAAILTEANEALSIHAANIMAMDYLDWYRRGRTPVSARKKEIRPEINNRINVAYADEIVTFKNGYFLQSDCFYVSRSDDKEVADKVKTLNEYLYRSGKQQADNKLVNWFHTVGKADLFIKANDDKDVPFLAYALDPRSAFVAKSLAPGNRPVYSGYGVKDGDNLKMSLSDDTNTYTLLCTKTDEAPAPYPDFPYVASEIISVEPNPLKAVPIIEYYYNSVMMGAFEAAVPLIDATSFLQSDRLDGVDQAVQSLLVFYNCELDDDDENGGQTPDMIRKAGALFLKSVGENKADLKEIVTNLDQSQTQVFIDNLREQILAICAMPFTAANRGYSNAASGTAQFARDGWYQASTASKNTEDLFKESNAYFDEIMLKILREKGLLDINPADIALKIVGDETSNIQSKAQAFQTLLAAGLNPELAAAKSNISNDPVADIKMSEPWLKMIWGDPFAPKEVITEEPVNTPTEGEEGQLSEGQKATEGASVDQNRDGQVRTYTQTRNSRKIQIRDYQRVKAGVKEQ